MLLELVLPVINERMTRTRIVSIAAEQGAALQSGDVLMEIALDAGTASAQDCPPQSRYRVMTRDRAWVLKWHVAVGDELEQGQSLGVFSTEPDGRADAEPGRALRITVAGIIPEFGSWDEWQ